MKWNVGTKIGTGFGAALVIFVIVGFVSWRNVEKQTEDAAWVAHTHKVISTLALLLSSLQDAETGQRGFVITGDQAYLAPYTAGTAAAAVHRTRLTELVDDNPRQVARTQQLDVLIAEKFDSMEETIETRRKQDFAAAQQLTTAGRGKKAMDEIRVLLRTMTEAEEELLAQRAINAEAAAKTATYTIFIGTGLAILLAGVIGLLITRNVAGPLRNLTLAAERITIGDLSASVDVGERNDEVGALGRAFARMTKALRAMAAVAEQIAGGDLRATLQPQSPEDVLGHAFVKMLVNLRQQIGGMAESATVLGSAASEIVASTAQLASGASESAAAVSETTTTVEEIRQTAQMASQKARAVSDTAQKAVQVSIAGRKSTDESLAGMNRIRVQMEAIGESMMRLSEQTQAIGQIIASVEDLAAQSNLLAVNAAIEAAKAGEQGKGFGVVGTRPTAYAPS